MLHIHVKTVMLVETLALSRKSKMTIYFTEIFCFQNTSTIISISLYRMYLYSFINFLKPTYDFVHLRDQLYLQYSCIFNIVIFSILVAAMFSSPS